MIRPKRLFLALMGFFTVLLFFVLFDYEDGEEREAGKLVQDVTRDESVSNFPVQAYDDGVAVFSNTAEPRDRVDLAEWVEKWRQSPSDSLLKEGVEIARARGERMRALIPVDPGRAIDEMLSFRDYRALPESISDLIEKPVASIGDVRALSVCNFEHDHSSSAQSSHTRYTSYLQGRHRELHIPDERRGLLSKNGIPILGIEFGNAIALHRRAALELSHDEAEAARDLFENLVTDIGDNRLLVGDQLWSRKGDRDGDLLNTKLIFAERQLGPDSVQRVLPLLKSGGENSELFHKTLGASAGDWSENPKSMLMVRLRFPDLSTSAGTKEEMEASLLKSSDRIREMSHGKTYLSAFEVTPDAHLLPNPSTHYIESGWSKIESDAKVLVEDAGYDFDDFDIVGFVFPSIPIGFRGFGTLGGNRIWINGSLSPDILTHEIGHSYGLGHASSWDANDGSIVPGAESDRSKDAAEHNEYGDVFDLMGSGSFEEGDFNVFGKRYLNWMDEAKILSLNSLSDDVYRLYRFDHPDTDANPLLGLELQVENSETYGVSYRRRFFENEHLRNGLYVIWPYSSDLNTHRLLDMTPDSSALSADKLDSALGIGETFIDPTGLIAITPVANGGNGASEWIDVRIVIGVEGNRAPSVTVSGPASGLARTPTRFVADAIDHDGDTLLYVWDFGDGKQIVGGPEVEHLYPAKDDYTVAVNVNDQKAGYAQDTMEISIADPLDPWTVLEDKPVLRDILFDRGRFLGVGSEIAYYSSRDVDHVYQSFDGVNWAKIEVGNGVAKIEYIIKDEQGYLLAGERPRERFNGRVQAHEQDRVVARSMDGITWEIEEIPDEAQGFRSVAYGNGVWIAVSYSERIFRKSSFHAPWEMANQDIVVPYSKVVFGDGVFMIGGYQNTLLRSVDDGLSWVDISDREGVENSFSLSRISYGSGLFLVGGSQLVVSNDQGETWIPTTGSNKPTSFSSLIVVDGFFHAGSSAHDYFSTDGIHWGGTLFPSNPDWIFDRTASGNGIIMQTGRNFEISLPSVKHGVHRISNVTLPNAAPIVEISGPEELTARESAQLTVTASDPDSNELYIYWDVGDGIFRPGGDSIMVNPQAAGRFTFKVAVTDGEGGLTIETLQKIVIDPLDPWTTSETVDGLDYSDVIYHEGRFFASGSTSVFTSLDGFNWSEIDLEYNLSGLAAGEFGYAVVGESLDGELETGSGVILQSRDGVNWTEQVLPPGTPPLAAIAYGDGAWVAVGEKGTIVRKEISESKWEKISIGNFTDLRDIAFGDGVFMIVGAELDSILDPLRNPHWFPVREVLLVSKTRGYSWEDRSRFSSLNARSDFRSLNIVAYATGTFIVGGPRGVSISHNRGQIWEGGPSYILREPGTRATHPRDLKALMATDEFLFASTRNEHHFSSDGINWNSTHVEDDRAKTAAAFGLGKLIVVGESGYRIVSNGLYENEAPSVTLSGPSETVSGIPYLYSIDVSDTDSDELYYFWDLGDGILVPGTSSRIVLNKTPGSRTLRVVVSDGRGGLSEASLETITVDPLDPGSVSNPNISLKRPAELNALKAAIFEVEVSEDDPDALTYYWDEGDGAWHIGGLQREITPMTVGDLTIRAMVTNAEGGVSKVVRNYGVLDGNVAPIVTIADPLVGYAGQPILFTASVFDKNGDDASLIWNFGDGTSVNGDRIQSHTFQAEGIYEVSLSADDGNGGVYADTVEVVIEPALDPQSMIVSWLNEALSEYDPKLRGLYHDPDHDGMINLVEYALGLDPSVSDASKSLVFTDSNLEIEVNVRGSDPAIIVTFLLRNGNYGWRHAMFQFDTNSETWVNRSGEGFLLMDSPKDRGDGLWKLSLRTNGSYNPALIQIAVEFAP